MEISLYITSNTNDRDLVGAIYIKFARKIYYFIVLSENINNIIS